MEESRRSTEKKLHRIGKRRDMQNDIGRILGIDPRWWGEIESNELSDDEEDESLEDNTLFVSRVMLSLVANCNHCQTPSPDYTSMLVYSPHALPDIFQSLITDFRPSPGNAEPANSLYMLSRFACLNCDHNWVEDLVIGATDTIEETFFVSGNTILCTKESSQTFFSSLERMTSHASFSGYTT